MRDDEEDAGGAGFGSECDVRCEIGAASLHLAFVREYVALYILRFVCMFVRGLWPCAAWCVLFCFCKMYGSAERGSC